MIIFKFKFYLIYNNLKFKMENENFEQNFDVSKFEHIKDYEELKTLFLEIEKIYYTFYKKEREEKLEESINKLIKLIDNHLQNSNQLSKEEISFLYFIKCLSLDKLPKYSKESEDSVNKSVSLKNSHIIRINYFSSSN